MLCIQATAVTSVETAVPETAVPEAVMSPEAAVAKELSPEAVMAGCGSLAQDQASHMTHPVYVVLPCTDQEAEGCCGIYLWWCEGQYESSGHEHADLGPQASKQQLTLSAVHIPPLVPPFHHSWPCYSTLPTSSCSKSLLGHMVAANAHAQG